MAKSVNWFNSDGLLVKFGELEGVAGHAGEYRTNGAKRQTELAFPVVSATTLLTTTAILDQNTWIPKGAFIETVTIEIFTAVTSGGSGTLTVGLTKSDQTTSLGTLVNAAAVATLTPAGTTLTLTAGSTAAGNLIGTVLVADGLFAANWGTSSLTAGAFNVRVDWSFPAT